MDTILSNKWKKDCQTPRSHTDEGYGNGQWELWEESIYATLPCKNEDNFHDSSPIQIDCKQP